MGSSCVSREEWPGTCDRQRTVQVCALQVGARGLSGFVEVHVLGPVERCMGLRSFC